MTMKNHEKLECALKDALNDAFSEMSADELKKIDWLCWNADFFIEKDKIKAA